jgi:hypothetical protein
MRDDRNICLGKGLSSIPIGLLRAQSEGKVLFIVGAGVSKLSGLPLFKGLVQQVYQGLDPAVYEVIKDCSCKHPFDKLDYPLLQPSQLVEVKAFCEDEFDLALGLLERRMLSYDKKINLMRSEVVKILRENKAKPSDIHKSIIKLSDRGRGLAVVTTNFDLLLEESTKNLNIPQTTYSVGEIMRPSARPEFSGILHIHGSIEEDRRKYSDLILTDEDFGQHYLRARSISDFIYDASRIYSLVFVGYGVNDPPMKYLLSAVAADHERFLDLKPRYLFIPTNSFDQVELEYWKGKGINPIYYETDKDRQDHSALELTFNRWAALSDRKGQSDLHIRELKRIVRNNPSEASEADKDCFELIFDLSPHSKRLDYIEEIAKVGASFKWLDIVTDRFTDKEEYSYAIRNQSFVRKYSNPLLKEIGKFLLNREMEKEAFTWALSEPNQSSIKRLVISDYFENPYHFTHEIDKIYQVAWELLIESWNAEEIYWSNINDPFILVERIKRGKLSLSTIRAFNSCFCPRILFTNSDSSKLKKRKKVRTISDLILPNLEGIDISGLNDLIPVINEVKDITFLETLYRTLSYTLERVFYITEAFGWNKDTAIMLRGGVKSVAFREDHDPDRHSKGFASVVKLLHAIVGRIGVLDRSKAQQYMRQLKSEKDALSIRLWASFAVLSDWVSSFEIGEFLIETDSKFFWEYYYYPEIAELRSIKFSSLELLHKKEIWRRIRTLPPKSLWRRKTDPEAMNRYRYQLAFQESRRIEKEGNEFPLVQARWIEKTKLKFPQSLESIGCPDLYKADVTVNLVTQESDEKLVGIKGIDRLVKIEKALKEEVFPVGAIAWIRQKGNELCLLDDMITHPEFFKEFPRVWIEFCYFHDPEESYNNHPERNRIDDFNFIFSALQETPGKIKRDGLKAFCQWIGRWKEFFKLDEDSILLWSELLDISESAAVEETRDELSQSQKLHVSFKLIDLDNKNHYSPIGQLVDVFIQQIMNYDNTPNPFQTNHKLYEMRERLMRCEQPARDIVLYRLAEILSHLLQADNNWTNDTLVNPLTKDYPNSRPLWTALSHKIIRSDTLKYLRDSILEPCKDESIDRNSQHMLLLSVVLEILNAYRNGREPFVNEVKFKQLFYNLDDEARSSIAEIFPRYLKDMSETNVSDPEFSRETLFRKAITPFIKAVWPKEPFLVTPSIAQAFARLPAATRTAFSEAVELIERYIIPFECYSLYSFGMNYSNDNKLKMLKEIIDSSKAAESFLTLLDKSIAYIDSPIRPVELSEILGHIREIDSDLEYNPIYMRLEMLT